MAVPLLARGRAPRHPVCSPRPSRRAYDDGRAEIAAALVGQAMVAYENARLFAQVQQLATIDALTGMANRRHFFDLADRRAGPGRRHGRRPWPP